MPIEAIILDLDETLIYGRFKKNGGVDLKIRPYCASFLKYIFDNFYVAIWTHANVVWCDTVLSHILTAEQKKKVCFVYTSENGCARPKGDIKCLSKIYSKKNYKDYFNSDNTLILEDTIYNITENVHNGIIVPKYKGHASCTALKKVQEQLVKYKDRSAQKFPKNIKFDKPV